MVNFHHLLQVKISHCLFNWLIFYNIFLTSLPILHEQLCQNRTSSWWKWIILIKCQKYNNSNFIICHCIIRQSLLLCSCQYQRVQKIVKTIGLKCHYELNGILLKFQLKIDYSCIKWWLLISKKLKISFGLIIKYKLINLKRRSWVTIKQKNFLIRKQIDLPFNNWCCSRFWQLSLASKHSFQ